MSYTRYTVRAGKHDFRPNSLRLLFGETFAGWFGFFSDRSAYDLGTSDQLDYNKFFGWSFSPFTNHRDAAMLGWRYSFPHDGWGLTPYYHVRGRRVIGANDDAKPLALVKKNQVFAFWLEVVDKSAGVVRTHLETLEQGVVFSHTQEGFDLYAIRALFDVYLPRQIGSWFGGNRPAPVDLELFADRIGNWQMNQDGTPARPVWDDLTGN